MSFGGSRPSPRLLVVEDDRTRLFVFGEALAQRGYDCSMAASFDDARAILERSTFDAVIADWALGGESGLKLLQDVASRAPKTKRILITGTEEAPPFLGGRSKIDVFFRKPVEVDDICEFLRQQFQASPTDSAVHPSPERRRASTPEL